MTQNPLEAGGPVWKDADGNTFWGRNRVEPCPLCGVAPTNVDDCGCFGFPGCPAFGCGQWSDGTPVSEADYAEAEERVQQRNQWVKKQHAHTR